MSVPVIWLATVHEDMEPRPWTAGAAATPELARRICEQMAVWPLDWNETTGYCCDLHEAAAREAPGPDLPDLPEWNALIEGLWRFSVYAIPLVAGEADLAPFGPLVTDDDLATLEDEADERDARKANADDDPVGTALRSAGFTVPPSDGPTRFVAHRETP